ncbi:MAG: peptidoglycan-binding domain-containing protein [Thermoanaerobaculia bacterium]
MPFHTVQQGQTLLGLASSNGLDSWEDIVNASENASIKDTLTDPGILKPGLSLFIPNKTMKQQPSAIDAKHPFTVKRPKAWLRLAIKDADGTALANCRYDLTVAGTTTSGTIAADGILEQAVAIDTNAGKLKVWLTETTFEEWELKIGWMDPITEESGVKARLANLGFDLGDDVAAAVKAFQARIGLEPTGTIDDTLRDKLKTYYDPAQDETTQDVEPETEETEEAQA